jgi:multiple sugar transport system substrate-binding protein
MLKLLRQMEVKMKSKWIKVAVTVLTIVMAVSFLVVGCKTTTTETTALAETTVAAETTAVAETTAAAETTAGPSVTGKIVVGANGWPEKDQINASTRKKMTGYQVVLDEFAKLYPDVTVEFLDLSNDPSKVIAMQSSGTIDVCDYVNSCAEGCMDLGTYITRDAAELGDLVFGGDIEFANWNTSEQKGMPEKAKVHAIYYDKQIFDEWGVEYLNSPTTWDEILEKAEKMTGINPVSGVQNYGFWKAYSSTIEDVIQNYSSRITTKNIAFDITGDEFYDQTVNYSTDQDWKDAMKYYKDIFAYTDPGAKEWLNYDKMGTQDNNLAIMQVSWTDGILKQAENGGTAGDLTRVNRIGFVDQPRNPDGKLATFFSQSIGMGISKNAPNKEAAWAFIKMVATNPVVTKWLYDNLGYIPVNKAGLEMTGFNDKYPDIATIITNQTADALMTYKPFPGTESIIDKYCNLYWTDAMTLDDACAAMQKEAQQVIDAAAAAQ